MGTLGNKCSRIRRNILTQGIRRNMVNQLLRVSALTFRVGIQTPALWFEVRGEAFLRIVKFLLILSAFDRSCRGRPPGARGTLWLVEAVAITKSTTAMRERCVSCGGLRSSVVNATTLNVARRELDVSRTKSPTLRLPSMGRPQNLAQTWATRPSATYSAQLSDRRPTAPACSTPQPGSSVFSGPLSCWLLNARRRCTVVAVLLSPSPGVA